MSNQYGPNRVLVMFQDSSNHSGIVGKHFDVTGPLIVPDNRCEHGVDPAEVQKDVYYWVEIVHNTRSVRFCKIVEEFESYTAIVRFKRCNGRLIGRAADDQGTDIVLSDLHEQGVESSDVSEGAPYLVVIIGQYQNGKVRKLGCIVWELIPYSEVVSFDAVNGNGPVVKCIGSKFILLDRNSIHAVSPRSIVLGKEYLVDLVGENPRSRFVRIAADSDDIQVVLKARTAMRQARLDHFHSRIADALRDDRLMDREVIEVEVDGIFFTVEAGTSSVEYTKGCVSTDGKRPVFHTTGTVTVTGPLMYVDGRKFHTEMSDVTYHGLLEDGLKVNCR